MIVADANLLAHLFLETGRKAEAERALQRDPEWVAPLLWRSEFRNVLVLHVRHGRLTSATALRMMQEGEEFMSGKERYVSSADVLETAFKSGCSAYDCEYVALAARLNIPLVTSDRKILAGFPRIAIAIEDFAA